MSVFQNYTPHTINVETVYGKREFPSLGDARVSESTTIINSTDDIELRRVFYKEITGLPEPMPGKMYIVSMVVAQANRRSLYPRKDLVSPDTGSTCLRNEKGQIRAVTGFVVY